jgi:hypothetical protein
MGSAPPATCIVTCSYASPDHVLGEAVGKVETDHDLVSAGDDADQVTEPASVATAPEARRGPRRREVVSAFVVLSLAVLVVLAEPLTSGGYHVPGDVSEATPLLRVAPSGYQIENPEMNDVGGFVLPYLDWNRAELRSGDLPLWNPYNGSGAPHMANGQSRVFSPFSVPFYVLPLRAALIVANYATLVVAGMLAYGLVRHLGRSHLAGLVAAIGYMFCGGVLVWLHWGISGAAAFAPGMVWAASAAAVADGGRARGRAVVALAACVTLSLVAGHPETTFFGAGTAVVFAAARLAVARPTRRRALAGAGAVAGGVLLGAAVAAVQLLPLLEYIGQSPGLAHHGGGPYHQWRNVAVHAFPLALGSPGQAPRDLVYDLGLPLIENIAPYVGVALLLLAVVGAVHAVRRRRLAALVFVAGALGWIAYSYNVAAIGALVGHVPVLDLAYPLRATPLWDLSIVVLAAVGVDALRPPEGIEDPGAGEVAPTHPSRGTVARRSAPLVAGGTGLLLAGYLAHRHLRSAVPSLSADDAARVAGIARDHIAYVVATTAVAVAAAAVLATAGGARARRVAGGVLVLAVFAQTGFMFRQFNPTVPGEMVLPRSDTLEAVTEATQGEQTLMLDDTSIPPDMNLWYRQPTPFNYDAVGVGAYTRLYRQALRSPELAIGGGSIELTWLPVDPISTGALRAMGARYVTTVRPYPFGELVTGAAPVEGRLDGRGTATFDLAEVDDVDVVAVALPTGTGTCTLTWRNGTTGAELGVVEAPCGTGGAVFSPGEVPPSAGGLVVQVRGPSGGSRPPSTNAPLLNAYRTDATGLELVTEVDGTRVFRVPGAAARYLSPAATTVVATGEAARTAVVAPDFEPLASSVIEDRDAATSTRAADPGEVEVLEEGSGHVRLRVRRDDPGWLVAMQSHYPGWHASVDGDAAPVRRANAAFLGVAVPEGESVVELRYRPASVTVGALVSAAALLVLLALLAPWAGRNRHD